MVKLSNNSWKIPIITPLHLYRAPKNVTSNPGVVLPLSIDNTEVGEPKLWFKYKKASCVRIAPDLVRNYPPEYFELVWLALTTFGSSQNASGLYIHNSPILSWTSNGMEVVLSLLHAKHRPGTRWRGNLFTYLVSHTMLPNGPSQICNSSSAGGKLSVWGGDDKSKSKTQGISRAVINDFASILSSTCPWLAPIITSRVMHISASRVKQPVTWGE